MKYAVLLLTSFTLGACQKKPATPTELLVGKNWRITAFSSTSTVNGQVVVTDVYATAPACDRDDFIRFNTDNTLVVDQGLLKCDPGANQTRLSSWSFTNDQTKINGVPTSSPFWQSDIVELSATTFRVRLNPAPYHNAGFPADPTTDITYSSF